MINLTKDDLSSLNIQEDQIRKLKDLFPEIFTEDNRIDWDKLRLTLGEHIDVVKERFGMSWPGKADCFKTIQQPSIATLIPVREESVDFDDTLNIFIEGDNLEVLKLLQKSYLGKIKMIYIDPPYNTGNEFIYPDNYSENLQTYLEYTGQLDSEGRKFTANAETDGRFHSKWLNMLYPRLFLAKNLLRDDGLIFISIDDHEVHNLRAICNELFGEENFLTQFIWQKKVTRENRSLISVTHEYILLYCKDVAFKESLINLLPMNDEALDRYKNPDNDSRGSWTSVPAIAQAGHGTKNQFYTLVTPSGRHIDPPSGSCWRYTKEKMQKEIALKNIWFGTDGTGVPRIKKFLDQGRQGLTPNTILLGKDVGTTDEAKRELVEIFDGKSIFETPKPTRLIKHFCTLGLGKDDLLLDFFSGSGPSSQAVVELNKEDNGFRKYICVQLPEPTDPASEAYKAGFKFISDIGKQRMRKLNTLLRTQDRSSTEIFKSDISRLDLGFKVFKLSQSNFKVWKTEVEKTSEAITKQLELNISHISPDSTQEAILFELLLKSGFELTIPVVKITTAGKTVYSVAEGELLVCLEKEITAELIKAIAELNPSRVICLDDGFQNNDQLKTNSVQIMKSKGVVKFQTI